MSCLCRASVLISYRRSVFFSEGAGGTNPYFSTGAGGLLQAVINGFCGLEITDSGIKQLPSKLPGHWKKLVVKGVGPDGKTYVRLQK